MSYLDRRDFEFTRDGMTFTVRANILADDTMREPWKEADGHGEVSDWTRMGKSAGQLVLNTDHGSKRYYDYAEAIKTAKRDGWDAEPYKDGKVVIRWKPDNYYYPLFWVRDNEWSRQRSRAMPLLREEAEQLVEGGGLGNVVKNTRLVPAETRAMRAHKAVMSDFNYLRAWCQDQWRYVIVHVVVLDTDGEETGVEEYLGGVEDYKDHHWTEAEQMASALADGYGKAWGVVQKTTFGRLEQPA